MSFSGLVLTDIGKNELARAECGEIFCITHIVLGDGICTGTVTDIEELVHPVLTLPVTKIDRNDSEVIIECDFNSMDVPKAFYWREIGIIANQRLCYYDNSQNDAEFINPESDTVIKQKRMRCILLISSEIEVNTVISSALYVLDEDFQRVLNPQFQTSMERESIKSGENLFIVFGKIAKWLDDLKPGAFADTANNDTTTETGYVADARIVEVHGREIDALGDTLNTLVDELYNAATDSDVDKIINGTYTDTEESGLADIASESDIDEIIGNIYTGTDDISGTADYEEVEQIVEKLF